jgi:chromosome segregation ATPase
MNTLRRFLGVLVMCAGILGILLSLTGLGTIWVVKPTVTGYASTTIAALNNSVSTSQKAMEVTEQALGATIDSVDALSAMLAATAATVEDTMPVLIQLNTFMGDKLPTSIESATSSLETAQQAAQVLDSAIKSLDTFRFLVSGVPLLGAVVEQPEEAYNPEITMADSLGDLAASLEDLPELFTEMAADMDKADDNLETIQANLVTMSDSVGLISQSLGEYQVMIQQSQASMENLKAMLDNLQNNLTSILNGVAITLSLFFLWLLAAQIVILSQGWELYQGTAGRMEGESDQIDQPDQENA